MRLIPYIPRTHSHPRSKNNSNSSSKQNAMGAVESKSPCTTGEEASKAGILTTTGTTDESEASSGDTASKEPSSGASTPVSPRRGRHNGSRSPRWPHRNSKHKEPNDSEMNPSSTNANKSSVDTSEPVHSPRTGILKGLRKTSSKAVHKTTHAFAHMFQAVDQFMFPRNPMAHEKNFHLPSRVRGGVMLRGTETVEEHYGRIHSVCHAIKDLHGEEGLMAAGFEYRLVQCDEHSPSTIDEADDFSPDNSDNDDVGADNGRLAFQRLGTLPSSGSQPDLLGTTITSSLRTTDSLLNASIHTPPPPTYPDAPFCHLCTRRLFHCETSTMITESNRKDFIADGDMYEQIARLLQEYAHVVMCEEGNLEWVTIAEADNGREPIQALVNCNHPLIQRDDNQEEELLVGRPTLLIATGKGKVRAGIFSRQHLMCSGIESATALPVVREAVARGLNVVMVDPNVNGDSMGMVTFEKTMAKLFSRWEETTDEAATTDEADYAQVTPLQSRDLYILSHSASGSQLARYLLDKSDYYLPHIKAIAFTDSTHNIQWCKTAENEDLYHKLQSPECVYFRCASVRRDGNQWYLHPAGEKIHTDSFWQRRFGGIQTYWAGTNEHSLTNWYAHAKIWEHFDKYLGRIDEVSEREEAGSEREKGCDCDAKQV